MNEISMKAYAKINLCLDVLGKQANGYHQVEMVMQQVDLYDVVTVKCNPMKKKKNDVQITDPIVVTASRNDLPVGETNLAYKAAKLMQETYKQDSEIYIHLEKNIPVAAGLAGGSADGAAVLLALSQLWHLHLELQELMELGVQLGADVPFCIMGQAKKMQNLQLRGKEWASTCAFAEGIGEKLTPLPPLDCLVLLSKPSIDVSTAAIYNGLCLEDIKSHPDTKELILGLKEKNLRKIQKNMINVLETVTLRDYLLVAEMKQYMENFETAYQVLMSGSGPTIFALYTNRKKARLAYINSKKKSNETYLIRTLS